MLARDKKTSKYIAIKHIKVETEKKYKMIQIYRELSILEFLTESIKQQKLPSLFTVPLEVIVPTLELANSKVENLFIVMEAAQRDLREFIGEF